MEAYCPCTWLSLLHQKNEKEKRTSSFIMKILSSVPKLLLLKTIDLYTVYLFSEYAGN